MWINPIDARKRGIASGDRIRIFNDRGEVHIEAKVTPRMMPGVVALGNARHHGGVTFADMHFASRGSGGQHQRADPQRPSPLAKETRRIPTLFRLKL